MRGRGVVHRTVSLVSGRILVPCLNPLWLSRRESSGLQLEIRGSGNGTGEFGGYETRRTCVTLARRLDSIFWARALREAGRLRGWMERVTVVGTGRGGGGRTKEEASNKLPTCFKQASNMLSTRQALGRYSDDTTVSLRRFGLAAGELTGILRFS